MAGKKAAKNGHAAETSTKITDPRFSNIQSDPRFRLPSRKNTHVAIDKRFERMLKDDDFSGTAKVDRYGRRLKQDKGRKELEKYYVVDNDVDPTTHKVTRDTALGSDDSRLFGPDTRGDDAGESEDVGADESSTDSSSSDDEVDEAEDEEEVFGLLDSHGAEGTDVPVGEVSRRLAVVNLDWDNIRAADLMAVFSSFTPPSGKILNISVFPSEYGRERMEREEMEGPPKQIFERKTPAVNASSHEERDLLDEQDESVENNISESDDEKIKASIVKEDTGIDFNSAKLRRYQIERLRYFYAVITFSSPATAHAIYDAIDGTEYLSTANFFDLRYIPDSTDFSSDKARDECDQIPSGYKPNDFVTDALQHSKVKLTWDMDDGERKEAQKKAFSGSRADLNENDLKAYLGSDSSHDEESSEADVVGSSTLNGATDLNTPMMPQIEPPISKKEQERLKMRALLGLSEKATSKKNADSKDATVIGDMQITFSSGLTSNEKNGSVFENTPEEANETTAERYVRKEKQRKARRKEKYKGTHDEVEAATAVPETGQTDDLGFDDPFFAVDPTETPKSVADKPSKAAKRLARQQAETIQASQRAELERIMTDASNPSANKNTELNHFDMKALARAERKEAKSAGKRKKKMHLSERDKQAMEMKAKDHFKLDTGDQRFSDVFDRAEFAIDPSHPRFIGTEGMKNLLEEGRRKRKGADDGDFEPSTMSGHKRTRNGEDVETLVQRVKRKAIKS